VRKVGRGGIPRSDSGGGYPGGKKGAAQGRLRPLGYISVRGTNKKSLSRRGRGANAADMLALSKSDWVLGFPGGEGGKLLSQNIQLVQRLQRARGQVAPVKGEKGAAKERRRGHQRP